jgi:hypothetical protein
MVEVVVVVVLWIVERKDFTCKNLQINVAWLVLFMLLFCVGGSIVAFQVHSYK